MEESTNQKSKSALEKLAPFVLIVGAIVLGYFAFSKIQIPSADTNILPAMDTGMVQVEVDTDFLTSNAFTELKFIPDSSVFDEVNGSVLSGREDPFAPIK